MRTPPPALPPSAPATADCARDCRLRSVASCGSFMAFDLADVAGKQMCTMKGAQVLGNSFQQCGSPADLAEFLKRVYGNRKVATAMNQGSLMTDD